MKATIEMALAWEKHPVECTPSRYREFHELLRAYYMGQLHAGEKFVKLAEINLNGGIPERIKPAGAGYGCTCPKKCRVHVRPPRPRGPNGRRMTARQMLRQPLDKGAES